LPFEQIPLFFEKIDSGKTKKSIALIKTTMSAASGMKAPIEGRKLIGFSRSCGFYDNETFLLYERAGLEEFLQILELAAEFWEVARYKFETSKRGQGITSMQLSEDKTRAIIPRRYENQNLKQIVRESIAQLWTKSRPGLFDVQFEEIGNYEEIAGKCPEQIDINQNLDDFEIYRDSIEVRMSKTDRDGKTKFEFDGTREPSHARRYLVEHLFVRSVLDSTRRAISKRVIYVIDGQKEDWLLVRGCIFVSKEKYNRLNEGNFPISDDLLHCMVTMVRKFVA
jgi:hypothetical protein